MRPGKLREAREGVARVLISGAFKILALLRKELLSGLLILKVSP